MRLQKLAEEELLESQCGFRRGRSCADMIFTVRQLVKSLEKTISLMQSFHLGMKSTIRLDDSVVEIDVGDGLRQGCCMAPDLFNSYTCSVVERWLENGWCVGSWSHCQVQVR